MSYSYWMSKAKQTQKFFRGIQFCLWRTVLLPRKSFDWEARVRVNTCCCQTSNRADPIRTKTTWPDKKWKNIQQAGFPDGHPL